MNSAAGSAYQMVTSVSTMCPCQLKIGWVQKARAGRVEATWAKLYAAEEYERLVIDAQQVMGGDGWTRFYPLETIMRDAKVNQSGAGTSEVMRMVLYRQGIRRMVGGLKIVARGVPPQL